MKRLERHSGSPWDVFVAISGSSTHGLRRPHLQAVSPTIEQRYREYAGLTGDFSMIREHTPEFSPAQSDALKKCYGTSSAPLAGLKEEILESQDLLTRACCQHCGLNGPDTFDHYLPQESFPEFAVHPHNIVPCCNECNRNRSYRPWRDVRGCSTLHLYFDELETGERHLTATFKDDRKRMVFAPTSDTGGAGFGGRFARHFETLRLQRRMAERAPAELDLICNELISTSELEGNPTPAPELIRQLQRWSHRIASRHLDTFGANHWRVAVWFAVAGSPCFIGDCLKRRNPGQVESP